MPKKKRWSYRRLHKETKSTPSPSTVYSTVSTISTDDIVGKKGCKKSTMSKELRMLDGSVKEREQKGTGTDSGNRLVHWDSMEKMISDNCVCKSCGGGLRLFESTVGVATEVALKCLDCSKAICNLVRRTDYKKLKFRQNSSESYSLNCQFVMALMQLGCGNAESETLMNFLELPHGSTFKRSTFSRIQAAIRPVIKAISDKSMLNAMMDEIVSTHGHEKLAEYKLKNSVQKMFH